MFLAKQSGLLIRKEAVYSDQRVISTFDDFPTTNSVKEPWHCDETDGRRFNDTDWRITALTHTSR